MATGTDLAKLALRHPVEAAHRLGGHIEDRKGRSRGPSSRRGVRA